MEAFCFEKPFSTPSLPKQASQSPLFPTYIIRTFLLLSLSVKAELSKSVDASEEKISLLSPTPQLTSSTLQICLSPLSLSPPSSFGCHRSCCPCSTFYVFCSSTFSVHMLLVICFRDSLRIFTYASYAFLLILINRARKKR